jgi:hypothetical protein
MTQSIRERRGKAAGATLAGLLATVCALLLAPTSQAATLEAAGCFAGTLPGLTESCKPIAEEKFGEEVQLGGVGGMAVNYTGAGGVPKGTVYAATGTLATDNGVAMFEPREGEPGLKFVQTWGVSSSAGAPYLRCGPLLGLNGEGKPEHPCPTRVGDFRQSIDVDVDQATGEVFVYYGTSETGRKAIVAFDPDGSEEKTRFGEIAPPSELISESPAKIHAAGSPLPGMIAVTGAGDVYLHDKDNAENNRLMEFKPNGAGEYEYAPGEDVGASNPHRPTLPVADAAGNIYVASGGTFVEEYDPAKSKTTPICTYELKKGGITALTVDPLTGEPFFYSYRVPTGFKTKAVHQLGPCDEATGKFEGPKGEAEVGQFEVTPERAELYGLAFDPADKLEASRPAGILYGGAPEPVSSFNPGEPGQSSLGYVFAPPKLAESPPKVEAELVSEVTASSAALAAQVNPEGFEATWRFQYETQAAYEEAGESFAGAMEAPAGGGTLANRREALPVSASLAGLQPDTAYRYRAVAESECSPAEPGRTCEVDGATQAFHTFPATLPGLPDNRAWELVSPAQKHGGEVFPADPSVSSCGSGCKPGGYDGRFPLQSVPDGNAVAYEGTAFGSEGATIENAYIARRTATGWQSANPTPALLDSKGGAGYMAYSTDLGQALLSQEQLQPPLSPQAPGEYEDLYAQPTASPFPLTPLLTAQPPHREADEFRLVFAGASADLSRAFFAANDALTGPTPVAPEAPEVKIKTNEKCSSSRPCNLYEFHDGRLSLVNVAPGNASAEAGAFGAGSAHGVSADGQRVFWEGEASHVFAREEGERTREIPGSGPGAKFLAASTDGSRVLLSDGSLYDLEEETTEDLTEGQGGFLGLAGQSEGLAHLYFVDTAVLTAGEESCREGIEEERICEVAQATKENLYSWEEGTTSFVATLDSGDNGGGSHNLAHDWTPLPSQRTAEASPDGRYLSFLSQAPLTGYDSTGPCELNSEGGYVPGPCPEVFLYDSATGRLSCPSCNPSGERPLGWSVLRVLGRVGGWVPQPRYLFDSGRLFFDSQDSLSLADTNEGAEDVYENEPQGVGSCAREDGCVSLISAGTEATDSNFLAADETGANVFFTTRDRLTLRDKDELIDLYDAREGGGIAAETETQRAECSGEACQPSPNPPSEVTPSSAAFAGSGNLAEGGKPAARCPKDKKALKRKGKTRCVKKSRKKAHRKHKRTNRNRRAGK